MDRISDSGSEDLGSNPDGVTFSYYIAVIQQITAIFISWGKQRVNFEEIP